MMLTAFFSTSCMVSNKQVLWKMFRGAVFHQNWVKGRILKNYVSHTKRTQIYIRGFIEAQACS